MKKIVVLAAGTSTERIVSISSGTQVCRALRSLGNEAVLVDVCFGAPDMNPKTVFEGDYHLDEVISYIRSFNDRTAEVAERGYFFGDGVLELCKSADVVFMALHGANGEDGKIQATFELMGIPYTGCNYLASALAMDKEMAKELFRANNVPTPEGIVIRRGDPIVNPAQNGIGLPCVVKPSCGGSSVGVEIAHSDEEYRRAVEQAFSYEDVLIVEKYIDGREFSVGIVDGTAYPVIEITPLIGFYNYENKYKAGSTIETCPADLSQELTVKMQGYALDAWHALRLSSYARIDIMMDDNENIFCLEANTLPGMTPTSLLPQEAAVLGIDFAHLCEKLIQVSLQG